MRALNPLPDLEAFLPAQIDFAQFGDGTAGSVDLFSQVIFFSIQFLVPVTGRFDTRDGAGEPLSVDLNGEDITGRKNFSVPARGMRVLKTDGEGDIAVGSVQVRSDRPLEGVILFGGSAGVAGVGASQVLNPGFLAPIETRAADGINTGVAIRNLSENPLTLNARLLQNGVVLASAERTGNEAIAGNGHLALFVDQFDWDAAVDFSDFTGLLEVTSSDKMVATICKTEDYLEGVKSGCVDLDWVSRKWRIGGGLVAGVGAFFLGGVSGSGGRRRWRSSGAGPRGCS